jgi:hypothetical protein
MARGSGSCLGTSTAGPCSHRIDGNAGDDSEQPSGESSRVLEPAQLPNDDGPSLLSHVASRVITRDPRCVPQYCAVPTSEKLVEGVRTAILGAEHQQLVEDGPRHAV